MNAPNAKEKNYCQQGHQDDIIIRTLLSRELKNEMIQHVTDVGDDLFYREIDCDLLLVNNKYELVTVEIKCDDFPVIGNRKYVFLETISNSNKYSNSGGTDGLGCILTSKSQFFIFYFIKLDSYLIINSNKLRDFIKNNNAKYETKTAKTWSPDNKEIWYYSQGLLVPVSDLINGCGAHYRNSKIKYDDIKNELFGNNNSDENWDWFDDYFITF